MEEHPLETAAIHGDVDTLRTYQGDLTIHTELLYEALLLASYNGHRDCVILLLTHPRFVINLHAVSRAFLHAVLLERTDVVEVFVQQRLEIDPPTARSSLHSAVQDRNANLVRQLLRHPNVNPAEPNQRAIRDAVEANDAEIVSILLEHPGVDPDVHGGHPLTHAILNGYVEVARALLSSPRIRPEIFHNHALFVAAEQGAEEILQMLLDHPRVDPMEVVDGDTPLERAVVENQIGAVRVFLASDRVTVTYNDVYAAVATENVDILDMLLRHPTLGRLDNHPALRENIEFMLQHTFPAFEQWCRRRDEDGTSNFRNLPLEFRDIIRDYVRVRFQFTYREHRRMHTAKTITDRGFAYKEML